MRTIVLVGPGEVELNYMWLPTFIGMNGVLKQEMEKELQEKLVGISLDARGLDHANEIVIEYLEKKFPEWSGLGRYLDALKYIESKP